MNGLLAVAVDGGALVHSDVIWMVLGDWTCVPIWIWLGPSGLPTRALSLARTSLGIVAGGCASVLDEVLNSTICMTAILITGFGTGGLKE